MTTATKDLPGAAGQHDKAEIDKRRDQLKAPSFQEKLEAALIRLAAQGKEEDFGLLYRVILDSEGELSTAFGITPEELASCLFSASAQPDFYQARKNVEKLREIRELWEDQIEPEELKHWIRQKVPLFGGATPLEKLRQGKHEEVLHALALIKEGIHL